MRRRAMEMTTAAVVAVILILGVPLGGAWILQVIRDTPADTENRLHVILPVVLSVLTLTVLAFVIATMVAFRVSRRISAPLIYLAAEAEQLGSGQVRPRIRKSGIEEIDLVQAELVRSSERMAGRLAAERQFASDASHQLRTPLTSLTLRLEEIELISSEQEVREEAHACLEQVERLTGVVEDLLKVSRRSGGTTEVLSLSEMFERLRDEWAPHFAAAERSLVFTDESALPVLATPGSLAQVLATVIENSLRYGAGTTTVTARSANGGHAVFIDIGDEGPGVSTELAPDIFERHVSGHGSTGVGLALAKDLVEADGGKISLGQLSPPVFSVLLNAVPRSLDPDNVMPPGALVSVGRRRRF